MRTVKLIIAVSLTSLLLACTASTERLTVDEQLVEMGLQRGEGDPRIPSYRINGWKYLDDQHLTVTAGTNNKYLVSLRSFCFGLREAYGVGFSTPMSRLDSFGSIIVKGTVNNTQECRIDTIVPLEPI